MTELPSRGRLGWLLLYQSFEVPDFPGRELLLRSRASEIPLRLMYFANVDYKASSEF